MVCQIAIRKLRKLNQKKSVIHWNLNGIAQRAILANGVPVTKLMEYSNNLLTADSILLTGNQFAKFSLQCDSINLAHISETSFNDHPSGQVPLSSRGMLLERNEGYNS